MAKKLDCSLITKLMPLDFVSSASNVVLIESNGVGKTMIDKNIAHQITLKGNSILFSGAWGMLNILAAQDGALYMRCGLKYFSHPELLTINKVGYLAYVNRHSDL